MSAFTARLTARSYRCMYERMNSRGAPETRRVTANLPAGLVDDACHVTGKGITETLVVGLERALKGKLRLDIDIETSRERARR
jgi:hypothetical protein